MILNTFLKVVSFNNPYLKSHKHNLGKYLVLKLKQQEQHSLWELMNIKGNKRAERLGWLRAVIFQQVQWKCKRICMGFEKGTDYLF